ncbi:MAG: SDR family NAD(P)-dependent oxidoreductase [Crocinitomicaceae bacterium]|nr:SDR family NAD(P)-dependent oxidoreductase [Crocinitomicaceae bacterium]
MKKREKIAVMTGATSGFGQVVAQHLIDTKHKLVFLARTESKAKALIQKISDGEDRAEYILCDLSSLDSISNACEEIRERYDRIDLLVLNAGLWNFEYRESKDGIEETFQVNLLAPALLFQKLKQIIPTDGSSKVMLTASALHQGSIQYDDLEYKKNFSGFKAYRQSKLGVILITRLWAKLPEFSGISFYSVHPGLVKTQLADRAGWFSRTIFKLLGISTKKGARTHIHLIDKPVSELTTGEYYAKSKVAKAAKETYDLQEACELFKTLNTYLDAHLP